jgi:alkylation response protein AidB-like acyl-CoA dehydrogenase
MHFNLSDEQIMVREAAREFAQTELLPGVIARDEAQEFPDNLVKKMGALGFMGIMVSPKYGGQRYGYTYLCSYHGRIIQS